MHPHQRSHLQRKVCRCGGYENAVASVLWDDLAMHENAGKSLSLQESRCAGLSVPTAGTDVLSSAAVPTLPVPRWAGTGWFWSLIAPERAPSCCRLSQFVLLQQPADFLPGKGID